MFTEDRGPAPAGRPAEAAAAQLSSFDVAVIGGGPAGSAIATRLADKGWTVVQFEKDRHPRFHIGESLLPRTLPLLEQLGVLDDVARIGVTKYAAEFWSSEHGRFVEFPFVEALNPNPPYAYQVRRSEFDELLLRNSAAHGVTVKENWRVESVELDDPHRCRLVARGPSGQATDWQSRFLVDATGRDTFLATRLATKTRNKQHNSAAIFGHFRGARRREGRAEGNISIYWFEHGWFWMIPLRDDIMSVGAVCWPYYLKSRKVPVREFLLSTIALQPEVQARLAAAELVSDVTATGNYSYQSTGMYGRNYLMVGDAFAFIDPVFSTGVHFALSGAFAGADAVDAALREPTRATAHLAAHQRRLKRGLKTFSWFIYRITTPAMRHLVTNPRNMFRIRDAMVSLLAGDLFGKTSIHARLALFRVIYYLHVLAAPRANLAAYRQRRQNVDGPELRAESAPHAGDSR
jgi:flavin-dependent dehydrogenase